LACGIESKVGVSEHVAQSDYERGRLSLTDTYQALVEIELHQVAEYPVTAVEGLAVEPDGGPFSVDESNVVLRELSQLGDALSEDLLVCPDFSAKS
jgi:hypothetical protein